MPLLVALIDTRLVTTRTAESYHVDGRKDPDDHIACSPRCEYCSGPETD